MSTASRLQTTTQGSTSGAQTLAVNTGIIPCGARQWASGPIGVRSLAAAARRSSAIETRALETAGGVGQAGLAARRGAATGATSARIAIGDALSRFARGSEPGAGDTELCVAPARRRRRFEALVVDAASGAGRRATDARAAVARLAFAARRVAFGGREQALDAIAGLAAERALSAFISARTAADAAMTSPAK